jgi:DNA-nicking Smr family endonuclease
MNNSGPDKPVTDETEDDQSQFRNMVTGVTRLRQDKVEPYRAPRRPMPDQKIRDQRRVMDELLDHTADAASVGSGDEISWLKNGYPRKLLRQLRRGHYTIQEEIDLHGYTVAEAKSVLVCFLQDCTAMQLGCVRVIHGKGLGSPGRVPVLKGKVLKWLSISDDVIAICSAPATDGGTGAVYVLIRT